MSDYRPTWRKPVGILALFVALLVYAVAVVRLAEPVLEWPVLLQLPVWIILGTIWLLPLRRFLIWMETGHWG